MPLQPYVLPDEMGIDDVFGQEILGWTRYFHDYFIEEVDDFDARPNWRSGANVYGWYDEGYRIVRELRARFPEVHVKPAFAKYVFSINERRENMNLPPIHLPGHPKVGFIPFPRLRRTENPSGHDHDQSD
ncbi:hypothetical protein [Millisia brevis]|uniref:hypothetical protein n=1 Tax=Millisia brevis TaxID=264148 RepID=UPI00157CE7A6|nr:hypothetical protein [Millisia brevis]